MTTIFDLLFGDGLNVDNRGPVDKAQLIGELADIVQRRLDAQPAMVATEVLGVALGSTPFAAAVAPSGLTSLGKVLFDAEKYGASLNGALAAGADQFSSKFEVTPLLEQ